MNIIPTPVLPELSAVEAKPVTGGAPFSKDGAAGTTTQTSFSAVLTQANQQGPTLKPLLSGKDQSGNSILPLFTQGEAESVVTIGQEDLEGALEILPTPLNLLPGVPEGTPLTSENTLVFALEAHTPNESATTGSSPIVKSSDTSLLGEVNPENVDKPRSLALPSSPFVVKVALQGEVDPVAAQPSINPRPAIDQNPQVIPLPAAVGQDVPPQPALTREPVVPVQFGNRLPFPNVPLSFVNGAFSQGQVVGEPVTPSNLSATIPQNIQGTLPSSSGTLSTTANESSSNGTMSILGKGEGETGGSFLGFDQRGQQENGAAFSHKQQQASGHTLGGHAGVAEPGSEFRVSESPSAVRPDTGVDRSRTMNLLSPQRMQMEVMLADESKVQVDVLVKHQQVSAQLMTDQLMLRNLMLQHEPHLNAQMSSVGLELKQFGAEVSEQGLFGQHLEDSSDRQSTKNFNESEVEDASGLQASDVLVGAGVEADGRFHFVV